MMGFKLESDLVRAFTNNYSALKKEVIVEEMPIRFGNIDVVSIKSISLPFNDEQIKTLSKPSCAVVFSKVKNSRPISKKKLLISIGLSESTLNNVLYELTHCNLIVKNNEKYTRKASFVIPKTTITGYEAKLKDFNKAFFQAKNNRDYVDYSYLVFPDCIAKNLLIKKRDLLVNNNIGLIAVTESDSKILLKAKKTEEMSDYIRLLSIAKARVTTTRMDYIYE